MDINDIALHHNAAKGLNVIGLGFRLNKKLNKTEEEALAAKAFLQMFWSTLGIVLLFAIVLFVLTGSVINSASQGFQGEYDESRTGRVENGQIRYVKDELFYIAPEEVGLSADELPEGTHINLYFDKDGKIVAGENADERNQKVQSSVIGTVVAMVLMALVLILFAMISRKTFAKPWVRWLQRLQGNGEPAVKKGRPV